MKAGESGILTLVFGSAVSVVRSVYRRSACVPSDEMIKRSNAVDCEYYNMICNDDSNLVDDSS